MHLDAGCNLGTHRTVRHCCPRSHCRHHSATGCEYSSRFDTGTRLLHIPWELPRRKERFQSNQGDKGNDRITYRNFTRCNCPWTDIKSQLLHRHNRDVHPSIPTSDYNIMSVTSPIMDMTTPHPEQNYRFVSFTFLNLRLAQRSKQFQVLFLILIIPLHDSDTW